MTTQSVSPPIYLSFSFALRSHPGRDRMMPIPRVSKKGKKSKVCDFLKTIDIRPEKVDASDICYPEKVDITYSLNHTSFYLQ